MSKVKVTYTHKGWMGLCPVYMTNPYGNEPPAVDARHAWLEWLHSLSINIYGLLFFLATAINPRYEPLWPLRVTGELNEPKTMEFEVKR